MRSQFVSSFESKTTADSSLELWSNDRSNGLLLSCTPTAGTAAAVDKCRDPSSVKLMVKWMVELINAHERAQIETRGDCYIVVSGTGHVDGDDEG